MAPQNMNLGPTDRSLPIALLRARETIMEPVREMLSKSNLSEQKWRVLRVIEEAGPMEQTAIASRACLLLPSLSRILSAMETDGLLTRAAGADDRRKSIVTITKAGRDLIADHAPKSLAIFADLEARFGSEKLNTLLDMLEELSGVDL